MWDKSNAYEIFTRQYATGTAQAKNTLASIQLKGRKMVIFGRMHGWEFSVTVHARVLIFIREEHFCPTFVSDIFTVRWGFSR